MRVRVTVPGSSANFGPGFDVLGVALAVHNVAELAETDGLTVDVQGEGQASLPRDERHVVVRGARLVYEAAKRPFRGLAVRQWNDIPPGRGLGSSASAWLLGILGANALLGEPLGPDALMDLAVGQEGAWDELTTRAQQLFAEGKYLAGENPAREALRLAEASSPPDPAQLAVSLHNLAEFARALRHLTEAEILLTRAVGAASRAFGPEDPAVAAVLNSQATLARDRGVTLVVHANRSIVDAVNHAARQSTGDVLIVVSDDFGCPPRWDESIAAAIGRRHNVALLVHDGIDGRIMTLPIVDRAFYESCGYVYFPDYLSMYCDDDLTEHAAETGRLVDARHLRFPHRHPDAVGGALDETYRQERPSVVVVDRVLASEAIVERLHVAVGASLHGSVHRSMLTQACSRG